MKRKHLKHWLDHAIAKLMLARFLVEHRDIDHHEIKRLISEAFERLTWR